MPARYSIIRTGNAKYSALRDGVELDRPVRSVKAAQALIVADGGEVDEVEVIDQRDAA